MATEFIGRNDHWPVVSPVAPADISIGAGYRLGSANRRAAPADRYVVPVVRLSFYGFIATIPFETVNLGVPVEITMISLSLLLISLVFQLPLCFRKPPAAYWMFFLFLMIFAVPVFTSTPNLILDEAYWQLMVLTQLVLMSWVVFNVLKSERVARRALLVFALSCVVVSVLQQLGVSERDANEGGKIERATAFGFHPNNIARILSLGLLSLAGLAYAMRKSFFKSRLWVWAVIGLIGIAVVQTGSRGALLALVTGILVFVLKDGAASAKIRNSVVVLIGIIFIAALVFESDTASSRFESAVEEGNLARRETIYPTAWKMFQESPLFGWGAKVGEYELGARLAHVDEDSKNAHNLVLFLLISTGLVGTLPLLAGLWFTFLTAWRARHGPRGVLPLSLLMTVLVANMSGVWIMNKMHWVVMAYVLSSPYTLRRRKTLVRWTSRPGDQR